MSRPEPDRFTFVGTIATGDPTRPWAGSATFNDGRLVALGAPAGPGDIVVALPGGERLQPGYRDDHLHLRAMAAVRCSIDVSECDSNASVVDRMRSASFGANGWRRGWGYDEALLGSATLTAADLDAIDGPLVLHHRTGHAALLNQAAMERLGIDDRPDGILIDEHQRLAGVPPLSSVDLDAAMTSTYAALGSVGVVEVTDATHTNDLAAIETLTDARPFRGPAVVAMIGADRLDGVSFGGEVGGVTVGHAKVMPDGRLDEVGDLIREAHDRGFPAAVHVMDIETLEAVLVALETSSPPSGTQDRLEHCAHALPEQLDRVAELGVHVATQPSFVTHRAAKYEQEFGEVERDWLWPLRSLIERGVSVSLSSDGPVVPSLPSEWLAASVDRPLGSDEVIEQELALERAVVAPLRIGFPLHRVVRLGPDGTRRNLLT